MKAKPTAGNAYVFVLIIMMSVFLLSTAALGITASSRRISGQYIRFAGLYDLALSGAERAKMILQQGLDAQNKENKEDVTLADFLSENLQVRHRHHRLNYHVSYSLTLATGVYHVHIYIYPNRWLVSSRAYKMIDGRTSRYTEVFGRIVFEDTFEGTTVHLRGVQHVANW